MLKKVGTMEMMSACGLKTLQQQLEFRALVAPTQNFGVACPGAELHDETNPGPSKDGKMKQEEIKALRKEQHYLFLIK